MTREQALEQAEQVIYKATCGSGLVAELPGILADAIIRTRADAIEEYAKDAELSKAQPAPGLAVGAVASRADFTRAVALTPEIVADIEAAFYYQPWTTDQIARGDMVRQALIGAMKAIIERVPPSPDRSSAIRKLREVRMDCNSAISFHGKY